MNNTRISRLPSRKCSSARSVSTVQIAGGTAPATDALISGRIAAGSINIQPKSTLGLSSTGRLISTGSVNLTGQAVTVDGQVTGNAVTLGGAGTKIIAGKTVTIDNSRTVTIGGSTAAKVYAANYTGSGGNASTSGQFGGGGATTQKLTAPSGSNAPSF